MLGCELEFHLKLWARIAASQCERKQNLFTCERADSPWSHWEVVKVKYHHGISVYHKSLWKPGLRSYHLPLCKWHMDLLHQCLSALISPLNRECWSVMCRKQVNQRKQFISLLFTYHLPVCYVANAYRANKKPSVHTWLEEVQLPGVLTHQVELHEQPQLEKQEYSTQTMAFWGRIKEQNQWHTTRKQAPENKPSNLLNHLPYILSRFSQMIWKSYTLGNYCTMTHKERERGRETLNRQIRKFRKISPSPPLPICLKFGGHLEHHFLPRYLSLAVSSCIPVSSLSLAVYYLAVWKQHRAWEASGLLWALPEGSWGDCPAPQQHWQNAQDLVDFALQWTSTL